MQVCKKDLIKIVEKASTIDERLNPDFAFDLASENPEIINARIKQWCQVVAEGDFAKFQQHLSQIGLDLNSARNAVSNVRFQGDRLPAWAQTLEESLQARSAIAKDSLAFLNPLRPLPFEEIWLSSVYIAREKLTANTGNSYSLLTAAAHANLERSLLELLANLGARALFQKFKIFQQQKQPALVSSWPLTVTYTNKQYKQFIEDLLNGELITFFQEYSVLARLAGTLVNLWVETTTEFLQRLASDWSEIQQTFQPETDLGQVTVIQPNLSDRHRQGRSAIAILFSSGLQLVYKPKSLGTEKAYSQLLNWLNNKNIPLTFKPQKIIDRSTYGWAEFIEHLPCQNQAQASRYYQRMGMFLCLAYVLKGTDFLDENIIACGEYPVPIDLEMLLNHGVRGEVSTADRDAYSLAYEQMYSSVLDTGLLPRWLFVATGQSLDVSGLGSGSQQETLFKVTKWQNVNKDDMVLGSDYEAMPPGKNIPHLNGVGLSPSNYLEELIAGFRQMYQFLREQRDALLTADSPLMNLGEQQVRFTFRATKIYCVILEMSLKLEALKDGANRSIQLDYLSRERFWNDKFHSLRRNSEGAIGRLIAAEKQALEYMDIPLFTAWADRDALPIAANETIENCFAEPSIDLAIARLQQLSADDLEWQIGLIRGSLYAQIAKQCESSSLSPSLELQLDLVPQLDSKELVREAEAIAKRLQNNALHSPNGSASWIALVYLMEIQRFQLEPVSDRLYDGSCGIGIFLSALAKIQGNSELQKLTLAAIASLRQHLQNPQISRAMVQKIGIGGAVGCGSIIYGLTRIGQFLENSAVIEDATKAAALLTPEKFADDRKFDVTFGTAGAILGLLALYEVTKEPAILEQAIAGGKHLLQYRTASDSGFRTWQTVDGKLLTGFSHGAAGIAYALLRLYKVSNEVVFLEAAAEAIAYERSVFSPKAGNWPDFRNSVSRNGEPSFTNTWCHGAPGIGLARLGSLEMLNSAEIQQDIEFAIAATPQVKAEEIDHYCCGNFGRIELFLEAGKRLNRPELITIAQQQAAWAVTRARQTGCFQVFANVAGDTYSPGLFTGTAGIGYQLLRLAYPDLLPSLLLWE
ncbi:type 2 lanthipeptide synthetase LanM family protein [Kamptonema animale CS-326]|jgi:type 2 lantibiotic biosynthesis protein LanM|uniref:type 2 lanthipeptide synthetase LanM family protein n=1 Tax=Kamptonema animale TaxID=92934 RepID=UPI00232B86CD|nr:type 2 lanthipeptide synthetase LanM family protein [Kamptonema animale]MDB9513471.1 type 2 lanthipeptide synthetase LanM family protein [Kamptonema animale CS-326]